MDLTSAPTTLAPLTFGEILARFGLACLILIPLLLVLGQVFLRVTGVPITYPPLTPLPLLSGAVGGSVLCALGYTVLSLFIRDQRTLLIVFVVLGVLLLTLSFNLPWRLTYTKSLRFVGHTASAQMAQALLHVVVVGVNLALFLRR